MDLSILPLVPFPIELMSPKWTLIGVSLVIPVTVQALECVRAWFAFLDFQPWWVELGVCFAAPTEFSMMFGFVRLIAFNTFGILDSA